MAGSGVGVWHTTGFWDEGDKRETMGNRVLGQAGCNYHCDVLVCLL